MLSNPSEAIFGAAYLELRIEAVGQNTDVVSRGCAKRDATEFER
jgi:hypothetical protein